MQVRAGLRILVALSGTPWLASLAQAQAPNVRVAGRVQAQYRAASGDSSANFAANGLRNGFEIRRLRIQTDVRFGDHITAVLQPTLEMAAFRMRDAYLRVGFGPRWGITLGQEKAPFHRYEVTSSNTLPSIERGLKVYGLSGREALNDLLYSNGYIAQDLGAFVDYAAPGDRVFVKLGVVNGSRESSLDVNNAKSVFGRVIGVALTNADDQPMLQVGLSFAARDRAICRVCAGAIAFHPDSSKMTTAYNLEFEWGGFRPGLHVIGDLATGDNVRAANRINVGRNTGNLRTSADTAIATFRGAHVVVSYRVMTRGPDTRVIQMVEPALRLDLTNPDTGVPNDGGLLVTPVVSLHFGPTVLARIGVDLYRYRDVAGVGHTAREMKVSWQANF